jgi:hypothetical protein
MAITNGENSCCVAVSGTRVWCLVDVADALCLTPVHASSSNLRSLDFLVGFIINNGGSVLMTKKKEYLPFEAKCYLEIESDARAGQPYTM